MRKRTGLRRDCRGVTHTEVLVACLIIAILGSFAGPVLSSWMAGARLKAAARDIYGNLQRTKMMAIKTNANCSIVYSQAPDRYTGSGLGQAVTLLDYGSGVKFQGPQGQTYSVPTITFNARGTCNPGYVYLTDERNTAYYRVGPWTSGVIRFEKYVSGGWK